MYSQERRGGLAGKARRVHKQGRAARLQAQRMIDEFFDPADESEAPDRFIPIRGRSEFLPTVAVSQTLESPGRDSRRAGRQMELPWHHASRVGVAEKRNASSQDSAKDRRHGRALRGDPEAPASTGGDRVIRFRSGEPQDRSLSEMMKPPMQFSDRRKGRGRFRWKGFFVGCAIGSAAAAFALLVLQTVVR